MAAKSSKKGVPSSKSAETVPVLIEMRVQPGGAGMFAMAAAHSMDVPGLKIDPEFTPIPMGTSPQGASLAAVGEETYIVRGEIAEADMKKIEERPEVVKVWLDTKIAPFARRGSAAAALLPDNGASEFVEPFGPAAVCPIPPCDCTPGTPKGTIADVATYLGVNQIWSAGFRGTGIVVGIVDGGITAQGRTISSADTGNAGWPGKLIPRVIDGFPASNWGTTGVSWGWHGNMTSTDVLGMAPEANILDMRIAAGTSSGLISNALAAFQWAIDRHKTNGTPHILSNSWGIFQQNWDPAYATDPNHPFTRKVVDALNEGIIVLFAAGNCGATCPDGRCATDNGPGHDIWGANGHPRVITVGAVNRLEQFVGYSSQGPAALDPNKPDFCSITHFTGFFPSDSGTSAATPIAAGVAALLKQAKPSATHDQIKNCFKTTAKDIGTPGFDQNAGSGILQGKKAFDCLLSVTNPMKDITNAVADKLRTTVVSDKIGTTPITDATLATLDLGTNPAIDKITTITVLDHSGTTPAGDLFTPPRGIDPRALATSGRSPFILSTPHHGYAPEPSENEAAMDAFAQTIQQCDAAAEQLVEQIQNASALLHALERTYEEAVAAYVQLAGSQS